MSSSRRPRLRPRSAAALTVLGLLLAVPAAPASAAGTVGYGGTTNASQQPLVIEVGGGKVLAVTAMWRASCTSGRTFSYGGRIPVKGGWRIARSGRFSGTLSFIQPLGGTMVASGLVQVTGAIKGTSLKGAVTATTGIADGSTILDTCTTSAMAYTAAHRPGREFGGVTNQKLPVVVEMADNGRSIRHLHIGWQAGCSSGDRYQWGDFLKNFALHKGRFGATFTTQGDAGGGSTERDDYDVRGTVTRTGAKGTFTLTLRLIDGSGALQDLCRVPAVTFNIRS